MGQERSCHSHTGGGALPPCLYCQNSRRFSPRALDASNGGDEFTPEYVEHMESIHNTVVRLPGETEETASARLEARMLLVAQTEGAALIAEADTKISVEPKRRGRPRKVLVEA
jgi:hypothetical protein